MATDAQTQAPGVRPRGRSSWVDRRGRFVLVAVCLGFFMIQVDATVVNVALPAIGRDVGGAFGGLQWVLDSYTLVLAAAMLGAGSLADRLGARRVFEVGLVVFTLGSAACAAAPDLLLLICARTVQGAGAAALLPCSLALTVHEFPAGPARARALGVWGGMGSLGMVCGPLLGGFAVGLVSWRLVFVINIPAGVFAMALVRRFVRETPIVGGGRFDLAGLALGTLALGAAAGCFIEAGQRGWSALLPIGLLTGCALAALLFTVAERRADRPLLPLGLLRSRPFTAAVGVGFLFNFCFYGALFCLSLYLQRTRGESALQTGLLLVPLMLVVTLGALASGRLTARLGPRLPMLAGLGLAALGAGLLSLLGSGASLPVVLGASSFLGLCSLAMPAMTSVAVGALDDGRAGLASGVLNAARQSGGALGIAVLGALLVAGGASGGPGARGGAAGARAGAGAGQDAGQVSPGGAAGHVRLGSAMPLALAGYLSAIVLTVVATRAGRASSTRRDRTA